jgi:hypothetical protein
MCSLKQMPQAWTLIRTWPWPGVGISRSWTSKSAPGFGTTAIFIFGMALFLANFDFSEHAPLDAGEIRSVSKKGGIVRATVLLSSARRLHAFRREEWRIGICGNLCASWRKKAS